MKKLRTVGSFLLTGLFLLNSVDAQWLAGCVYEQNSGKKPVPAVLLRALSANQVASGTNGQYRLLFQDGRPGKSVYLSVEKEAWVVTNETRLDINLPQDPQKYQHSIIMCPKAVWERHKTNFKAVAEKFLEQSFLQKLQALKQKNAHVEDSIAALYQQLALQQKAMEELANAMTSVNLDEVSEKERLAYRLFEEGKIAECIQVREKLHSEAGLKAATQKKQQLFKRMQSLDSAGVINNEEIGIYRRNLREEARLALMQLDVPAADKKLAFLANEDSTEFKSLYDYTEFLQQQKQFSKAIEYGLKALKQALTDIERCKAQNTLGTLYKSISDFPSAHKMLQDAAAITSLLADSISVYSASFLATTQQNLGLLYRAENNYPAAAKALHTALEIRKRQTRISPAIFEPYLATAFINLGTLYSDNEDDATAENMYQQAAVIYQRLANTAPTTYDPAIASVQNNLGLVYFHQKKYAAADSAYVAAIRISRQLALKNPAAYRPDIAETCIRLGALYRTIGDYDIADSALQEALTITTELTTQQPATYQGRLAEVKLNIGLLYWAKGNYIIAGQTLVAAGDLYEQLSLKNPLTYLPLLANVQRNLGELHSLQKDSIAAGNAYEKALDIQRQLVEKDSVIYGPQLANALYKMAIWNKDKANYTSALLLLNEARLRYQQPTASVKSSGKYNSLLIQLERAAIYLKIKDTTTAIAAYQEAVQLLDTTAKTQIAELQLRLGRLYRSQNPAAAEEAFSKAAIMYQALTNSSPGLYETAFCRSVINLGELYQQYYQPQQLPAYTQMLAVANAASNQCTDSSVTNRLAKLSAFFADDCVEIKMLQNQSKRTIDWGKKLRYQQQIVARRKALIDAGKTGYIADLAKDLSILSWYQLLNSQFEAAEATSRQLLAPPFTDATNNAGSALAKEYLAPALLLQDKWGEAEKIYKAYKDLTYTTAGKALIGTFASLFIRDLDELEKAGITHKNLGKARLLLNEKASSVQAY